MVDRVPAWVSDGSWYANDPFGQHMAVLRWPIPVTTPAEREFATLFNRLNRAPDTVLALGVDASPATRAMVETLVAHVRIPTYPCAGCGKHVFPKRILCFWCRRRAR